MTDLGCLVQVSYSNICTLFLNLVQTTPEKLENAALFLRLDLPCTLIRQENAALFLQLDLTSTLIRQENVALFLRSDLTSTQIRQENVALFLRLVLPCALIRHENGACRERFSKRRNLKTPILRFSVDGKHFENAGALRNRRPHENHAILLAEFSSIKNAQ